MKLTTPDVDNDDDDDDGTDDNENDNDSGVVMFMFDGDVKKWWIIFWQLHRLTKVTSTYISLHVEIYIYM